MITVLPLAALARGVPIADGKSIIQHGLEIAQMSRLSAARELETGKKARIAELHQEQLDALDATLAMMTGTTPWIGDLEVIPGAEAEVLYDVEDDSPYAARLFGDGKTGIEEMIVATAKIYAGHPGLARAGLNPVEFHIWFQEAAGTAPREIRGLCAEPAGFIRRSLSGIDVGSYCDGGSNAGLRNAGCGLSWRETSEFSGRHR